ncbi:MAG: aspartate kinase [Nitrospina sp.]|jgi:aspartate kinase|nr:aspartate kinase [Nitrospina sp.]MBT3508503.1 aspartate kinase [Nitrospina sp.]MBT3875279.1 aspartate kinase [Nitrospina sp.]MBT4048636.1 aspartate kinase [Nitrospina sp.]MBT4559064.1 aspartate kinase [Nitrospina sp.]
MKNSLIVQKYGGTSVGTLDRIEHVADRISKIRKTGADIVVVVSAMAGETDKLLKMARSLAKNPARREVDLLLSSGERISAALLTIALQARGIPALSLTGRQIGLETDSTHTRARIKSIDCRRARKMLNENHVIVVAGFQGINPEGDVTTLGRGGSDTSAVALAVALGAKQCEIYTDVDGVYTSDPRMVPQARRLDVVSYDEMLEMASLGAKVLQIRCVEFAHKYKMPLIVKSSFKEGDKGTLICEEDPNMEQPVVSGIMCDKNQAKITLKEVPDQPGIAANIFEPLAAASISVDMIIQNVSEQGHTDMSFTLAREELDEAMVIMNKVAKKIHATHVSADAKIAKISIVGAGMRSHSGVAAEIFKTLSANKINILMISTSEIKVSCIIEQKNSKLAVNALHDAFKMADKPVKKKTARKVKAV